MKQFIAIDIGGTNIKYGIVSQNGDVLSSREISTPASADKTAFLRTLADLVRELKTEETAGIGIATLGAVDERKRCITGMCDNLPIIKDLPIADYLENEFDLPVSVMNDVKATALGEAGFGAGKGLDTFFCVALGTGIGGAFVYEGRIINGVHGTAGEVGYLWSGRGKSYEELASAKCFSEESKRLGENDGKVLMPALKGDPAYAELLDRWSMDVAHGLADIIYVLDPGTIIIGGAVSEIGPLLTERIGAQLEKVICPDFKGKTRIIPAKNGNASNMLGAIVPFLKE